jgi:hypothetical protein
MSIFLSAFADSKNHCGAETIGIEQACWFESSARFGRGGDVVWRLRVVFLRVVAPVATYCGGLSRTRALDLAAFPLF